MTRSIGGPLAAGLRWSFSLCIEDDALTDQALEFMARVESQARAFGQMAQDLQRLRGTYLKSPEAGGCAGCPD